MFRQKIPGPGVILWYDKQRKSDMNFGTWKVMRLYRAGSLMAVGRKVARRFCGFTGG
jgi:hypothetical protein